MSNTRGRSLKRTVAGVSAGVLTLTGAAAALAVPAGAQSTFSFTRLAGASRYATAASIATTTFTTSDTVLVASGLNFPDALAGNYLAGFKGAPILLVAPDSVPTETSDALTKLAAKNVIILGGTSAVSAGVQTTLSAKYAVTRVAGSDRYATAKAIAETAGVTVGTVGGVKTAILASGKSFADALTAGPLGYAKQFPVEITDPAKLSADTKAAFTDLGIKNVIIVGGSVAVSAAVELEVKALGITTTRLSGSTRQLTAAAIADYEVANAGFSLTHANLARGDDFADALAGGPHAGKELASILLTDTPNALGAASTTYLTTHSDTLTSGNIFGGTSAVSDAVKAAGEAAAKGTGTSTGSVTLASTSAPQGGSVTGTVTNPGTVNTVSVTGCGFTNQNLPISSTGGFTLNIPAAQTPGVCSLAFSVLRTDGTTQTQTISFTVTAAPTAATAAPDLLSAVANTSTGVVTYTYDKSVTGKIPVAGDFYVYDATGARSQSTGNPLASGSTVIAQFTVPQASVATLAASANNAVQDAAGHQAYAAAAPLGAQTQPAGITTGPDLQTVDNLRTVGGLIVGDFRFDQPVDPTKTDPTKFELVASDGVVYPGVGAVGTAFATSVDGRTVSITFSGTTTVPIGNIVRGVALPVAVTDAALHTNVLQSQPRTAPPAFTAGVVADKTKDPNLTNAVVAGPDTVAFTFDEPVSATTLDGTKFSAYNSSGLVTAGATIASAVRSSTDTTVVNVTFPAGTVGSAVGVSVDAAAVKAVDDGIANEPIGRGLQALTNSAGRTALPDLVSVKISVDAFAHNTVVYTFDKAVTSAALVGNVFGLVDANGTLFTTGIAVAASQVSGNTVTFSATQVPPNGFTDAQASAAVIGNVEDKTVLTNDITTGDVAVQR